jgi:hypothetical protein
MPSKVVSIERKDLTEAQARDEVRKTSVQTLVDIMHALPESEVVHISPTGRAVSLDRLLSVFKSIE